jgi:hypothetical protein
MSDALILTGFGGNFSYFSYYGIGADLQQAALNQPYRFGNRSTAELMNSTFGCADLVGAGVNNNADTALNILRLTSYFVPPDDNGLPYDYPPGYMITKDISTLQFNYL